MRIILKDPNDLFEQQLKNNIRSISRPILLDITFNGPSERSLMMLDEGKYTLSYSRPFFINILKPPLAEFEFVFSLEKIESEESVAIVGKIRFKKYIIGVLLFVVIILLYNIYNVMYQGDPFDSIFFIAMPIAIFTYLLIEYFAFRQRIKKFLNSIAN